MLLQKNIRRKLKPLFYKILNIMPKILSCALLYKYTTGRNLNIINPQRYTEKIQWYKLYYRNVKMKDCADKYRVRQYVSSKGLEYILNELYTVFQNPEDIDFSVLPDSFILKLSNGTGCNWICSNKQNEDVEKIRQMFRQYKIKTNALTKREWAYDIDDSVIIAERLLSNSNNEAIDDFKFICFDGKPQYIVHDIDRFSNHKRNIYDLEWNNLGVKTDCENYNTIIPKPENLDEMIEIAKKLSEGFPTVRVDLYSIQGKVLFGEMTFYPWGGNVVFNPDCFDFELGEHFILHQN